MARTNRFRPTGNLVTEFLLIDTSWPRVAVASALSAVETQEE